MTDPEETPAEPRPVETAPLPNLRNGQVIIPQHPEQALARDQLLTRD